MSLPEKVRNAKESDGRRAVDALVRTHNEEDRRAGRAPDTRRNEQRAVERVERLIREARRG